MYHEYRETQKKKERNKNRQLPKNLKTKSGRTDENMIFLRNINVSASDF